MLDTENMLLVNFLSFAKVTCGRYSSRAKSINCKLLCLVLRCMQPVIYNNLTIDINLCYIPVVTVKDPFLNHFRV